MQRVIFVAGAVLLGVSVGAGACGGQATGAGVPQEANAGAQPGNGATGPTLDGGLAQFFNAADYPPSALRAAEEGTVVARLSIGTDGAVQTCEVEHSSGSVTLDTTTCRIAVDRMKFLPAHDKTGRPVASTYALPVTWKIPEESAPVEMVQAELVDGAGQPRCVLQPASEKAGTSSGGAEPLAADACQALTAAIKAAGGLPGASVLFFRPHQPPKP